MIKKFGRLSGSLFAASVALTSLLSSTAFAQNVIRIGNGAEPGILDAARSDGAWEGNISQNIYEGLVRIDPKGKAVPALAESWEISEDGATYTFTLREGIKFSDGEPITPEDVVFSFQRLFDPAALVNYASLMYDIENAKEIHLDGADPETLGVKKIDDKTVAITFKGPVPYALDLLAFGTSTIIPKHAYTHAGEYAIPGTMVGSGAYVATEWLPKQHVKLEKNPHYYDLDALYFDEAYFYPTDDALAAVNAFKNNELDWNTDVPELQIDRIEKDLPGAVRISPYLGLYFYPMNMSKPPFDDVRVREALNLLVERELLSGTILKSGQIPSYSAVPVGTLNYSENGSPVEMEFKSLSSEERTERALKLLEEAGYNKKNPLTFELSYNTSDGHRQIAVALASMFKKAPIKMTLNNSEARVHYDNLAAGDFQLGRAGWIGDYNDAFAFFYIFGKNSGNNYSQYHDDEFEAMAEEALSTTDDKKRFELYKKMEAHLLKSYPIIPLYTYTSRNLVSPRLKGWEPNPRDRHLIRDLYFED